MATFKYTRNAAKSWGFVSIHTLSQNYNAIHCTFMTLFSFLSFTYIVQFSERQGTLDSIITKQPRTPPFSTLGLLDYLVELVVSKDDVRMTLLQIFSTC